jgi:hypothetical protein
VVVEVPQRVDLNLILARDWKPPAREYDLLNRELIFKRHRFCRETMMFWNFGADSNFQYLAHAPRPTSTHLEESGVILDLRGVE